MLFLVTIKPTPPPPGSELDWSSIDIDEEAEEVNPAQDISEESSSASHYIPCTGRDRDYCLHGGECRVFPDGRYKHCRYKSLLTILYSYLIYVNSLKLFGIELR